MSKTDMRASKRRGQFYWEDGLNYISVTNVLKVIDKGALLYWYGQEVYRAFVMDPTLDEKEALSAPWKKSSKAMDRGTTVHSIVESYKNGADKIQAPEPFQGYADAFYRFVEDFGFYVTDNEKTVYSKEHRYAGTIDLRGNLGQNKDLFWLIDVKTGKDIYPEAGLQLSAYKHAEIESGGQADRIGVLLLSDTGKYKFEEMEDRFDAFLAAKKLYEWKNESVLKKYGYL